MVRLGIEVGEEIVDVDSLRGGASGIEERFWKVCTGLCRCGGRGLADMSGELVEIVDGRDGGGFVIGKSPGFPFYVELSRGYVRFLANVVCCGCYVDW